MERCLNIGLPTIQLKEMLEKGTYLEFIEDLDTFENTLEYEDSVVYCIQRLFLEAEAAVRHHSRLPHSRSLLLEFEEEELKAFEKILSNHQLDYQLFMEYEAQTETVYYLNRKIGKDSRLIECDQYAIPLNDYETLIFLLNHKGYSPNEKLDLIKKEIMSNSTFENELSYRHSTNVN